MEHFSAILEHFSAILERKTEILERKTEILEQKVGCVEHAQPTNFTFSRSVFVQLGQTDHATHLLSDFLNFRHSIFYQKALLIE